MTMYTILYIYFIIITKLGEKDPCIQSNSYKGHYTPSYTMWTDKCDIFGIFIMTSAVDKFTKTMFLLSRYVLLYA